MSLHTLAAVFLKIKQSWVGYFSVSVAARMLWSGSGCDSKNGAGGDFLIATESSPAQTLSAATNKKVALRLIGIHSVNSTFMLKDAAGIAKNFTVYTQDGRELAVSESRTSLDISPGQRYDIIFTTPATVFGKVNY
jgi:FtsP/CotA-like multicopper oxidase with cupredoxin domain